MSVYQEASRAVRSGGLRPLIVVMDDLDGAMDRMKKVDPGLTLGRVGGGFNEHWADVRITSLQGCLEVGQQRGSRIDLRGFDLILVDSEFPTKTPTVVIA